MGRIEQCTEWFATYLEKLGIENDHCYHTFATPDGHYVCPEKVQVIRLGDKQLFIGLNIENARVLLGRLEAGRDITLRNIRKEIAEDGQYQLNERVIGTMCTYVVKYLSQYFTDVMKHLSEDVGFDRDGWVELADLTQWYLENADDICRGVAQDYADGTARIHEQQQEKRARLDQQTAVDIANAPQYVHIQGRIKDGFFGPRFEGSVTSTSTMSQADIIRAYDNNRSTAWYEAHQSTKAMGQHLVKQLLNDACELVGLYYNDLLTFLKKHLPQHIHAPTILEDSYDTRPYTFPHLLEILQRIPVDKLSLMKLVVDYYKIDIDRYMPEHLGKQFVAHYDHHGNCRYDGHDLRFYLLLKGMDGDDIWDQIWLHRYFQGYFERKVQARYEELLARPKLEEGICPDTPPTAYFGDIIEEAERCVCVSPRGIRMTTEKAEALTKQLYESRPKKLFGKTRY